MSTLRRSHPVDATRERNANAREQRADTEALYDQELKQAYHDALAAGIEPHRLPTIHGQMGAKDRAAALQQIIRLSSSAAPQRQVGAISSNTIYREPKSEVQQRLESLGGVTPHAAHDDMGSPGALDALGGGQPAFGSTRNNGLGLEAYMADDRGVKGGGRWVNTTGHGKAPMPAAMSGLSTVVPNQEMGGGFRRLPVADVTVPGGKPGETRPGSNVIEYNPATDPGRGTLINNGNGTTSRTIDPKYQTPASQIGKGEVVGSGAAAPDPAVGTLKPGAPVQPGAAPVDPWGSARISHPNIFTAGHADNVAFRSAWGKQQQSQGKHPLANPTPQEAVALADRLFSTPRPLAKGAGDIANPGVSITSGVPTEPSLPVLGGTANFPPIEGAKPGEAAGIAARRGVSGALDAIGNEAMRVPRAIAGAAKAIGEPIAAFAKGFSNGPGTSPPPPVTPGPSSLPLGGSASPALPVPTFQQPAGALSGLGEPAHGEASNPVLDSALDTFKNSDSHDEFLKRLGSSALSRPTEQ